MKLMKTSKTLVSVLALVAFFGHLESAQGQPLTDTSVVEADILALIAGPPVATAGVAFTLDLQGDPGIIQSAAYPMADGNFLYAYQWECHTGPNWDILTLHIPMAGSTPVAIDIDGIPPLDDSWSITDKTGFMPYNQQPTGLQALCGSDSFSVSAGDFETGATFDSVQDEIVFRNSNGIFLSSNIYGFIGCTPPQIVQTTAGGGNNFGTTVVFTTAPFPVVAPSGPCTCFATEFLDCRPTSLGQPGDPICDLQQGAGLNDLVSAAPTGALAVIEPNTSVHQSEWESAPSAVPVVLLPGPVTLDLVLTNLAENAGSNDICWSKHAVAPDGTETIIVPFHCFENPLPVAGFICPFGGVLGGLATPVALPTPDIPAACLAAAGLVSETVVSSVLVPTVLPAGTVTELSVACPGSSFLGIFFNNGLDVDGDGILEFSKITEPVECNNAPVCDANGPYAEECQGATTSIALDGTGSSNGTLLWTTDCPGGTFDDDTSATPILTVDSVAPCPLICEATLTVSGVGGGPPASTCTPPADDWVTGDVFAGVGGGTYQVYDNAGIFKESISDGLGGFTTGCAFNPGLTKLYTTNFSATKVPVYDDCHPHAILQTVDTAVTSPGGDSESVVFAANGDFYVGHPDGNDLIHKYDSAGTLITTFSVAVDNRGTDWIDLAADQKTLFYTSEGRAIQRYDTDSPTHAAQAQLANFAVLPGPGNAFALRLLPPGDGSGGLLVADNGDIKRLDSTGAVVQTYDVVGEGVWFSLNLDPNGTSFWAGTTPGSNNFYRFNIASGAVEVGPINTGGQLFGLCVKGEPTAGVPSVEICTATVTITDTTDPVLSGVPADATVRCDNVPPPANPTASDNCDTNPTIMFSQTVTQTGCPADPVQDIIERTWTATDACGKGTSDDQTILVEKLVLSLDIKPESCPNPYTLASQGLIPMSLLGSAELDVTTVDTASIVLSRADCVGGTATPSQVRFEDVGTPFEGQLCDCHVLGPDGVLDLSLKFGAQDVVSALLLDQIEPGQSVELVISGAVSDECEFIAADCMVRTAVAGGDEEEAEEAEEAEEEEEEEEEEEDEE